MGAMFIAVARFDLALYGFVDSFQDARAIELGTEEYFAMGERFRV
jgi:hypothetical protein